MCQYNFASVRREAEEMMRKLVTILTKELIEDADEVADAQSDVAGLLRKQVGCEECSTAFAERHVGKCATRLMRRLHPESLVHGVDRVLTATSLERHAHPQICTKMT